MKLIADNKNQVKAIMNGPFSSYCKTGSDTPAFHKYIPSADCFRGQYYDSPKSAGLKKFIIHTIFSNLNRYITNRDEYFTLRDRYIRSELSVDSFNSSRYLQNIVYRHNDYIV